MPEHSSAEFEPLNEDQKAKEQLQAMLQRILTIAKDQEQARFRPNHRIDLDIHSNLLPATPKSNQDHFSRESDSLQIQKLIALTQNHPISDIHHFQNDRKSRQNPDQITDTLTDCHFVLSLDRPIIESDGYDTSRLSHQITISITDREDKTPQPFRHPQSDSPHSISIRSFLKNPETTPAAAITRDFETRDQELEIIAKTFVTQAREISTGKSDEVDAEAKSIVKSRIPELAAYPQSDQLYQNLHH